MKTWTVVYRTGGTVNFQWHRSLAFDRYDAAVLAATRIHQGGRPAMVFSTEQSEAIGLPETFAPGQEVQP